MTLRFLTVAGVLALASGPTLADDHSGPALTGYALGNGGTTLLVMPDLETPGEIMAHPLAMPIDAIAFRPVTGDLLGYTNGAVYTIDPTSGALTDLGAVVMDGATVAEGAMVGFDFNNAIDAVRVVSSAGDNLVYFPQGFGDNDDRAGSLRRFTDLAYVAGDTNEGAAPMIFANAYTNAIVGMTASGTLQYALDAATDALVTLANNDGTLMTVAPVTVDGMAADLSVMGGFDIVSPEEGTDMAYAILQMEGSDSAGLYSIELATGAATLRADLGMGGFTGFAVSMSGM
ncbi:DUF4394 domain-containing protein [Roseicyclus mahoneyensis]|uniref:Uncharacterized protein DUF4394 n=1 Tax=Roseicyclus mahoneyensis TaxID=164332 RepID=A0A316GNH6_9RHOB|nr:DUF4394 domain-containing protein [Roseicyclus mahoneyensis]PWK61510.1 uncharacterized protein DUF4394 [Roseicyclus mahoneyensis]